MKALLAMLFVIITMQEKTYQKKHDNDELIIHYSIVEEAGARYLIGKIQRKSDEVNIAGMNIIAENNREGTVSNQFGEFRVSLLANSGYVKFSHNLFKTIQLKTK
jgi:hypothetical protein